MNEEERKQKFYDALDNLREVYQESSERYDKEADEFWNGLDYDQKLMAFHSVCKRIWKGDVIDRGSYRYVLYDVFGFGMDAYTVGMDCHYLDLHNFIFDGVENSKHFNPDFYQDEKSES